MDTHPKLTELRNLYTKKNARYVEAISSREKDQKFARRLMRIERLMKIFGVNNKNIMEKFLGGMFQMIKSENRQLSDVDFVLVHDDFPESIVVDKNGYYPYIALSTALPALIAELSLVQADISNKRGIRMRSSRSQIVGLRYLALQRLFYGKTGVIARKASFFYGQLSRNSGNLLAAALFFTLCHEAAHIILKHDNSSMLEEISHRQEYEADELGFELARGIAYSNEDLWLSKGVVLAMLAFEFIVNSEWLRPPLTHPPAYARINNIIENRLIQESEVDWLMLDIVQIASDTMKALPLKMWQEVINSSYWDTSIHDDITYKYIAKLDVLCGFDQNLLRNNFYNVLEDYKIDVSSMDSMIWRVFDQFSNPTEFLHFRDVFYEVASSDEIISLPKSYRQWITNSSSILIRNDLFLKG